MAKMSTKFTTESNTGWPVPLTVLLQAATQAVLRDLIQRLKLCGHEGVTEPHLVLFGNLDCGATHASQIAQRMQVSRQAISKTLRELQSAGLVTLEDDRKRRNQKLVVMTERGMQLAVDARRALAEVEADLSDKIGPGLLTGLRLSLEAGWNGSTRPPTSS